MIIIIIVTNISKTNQSKPPNVQSKRRTSKISSSEATMKRGDSLGGQFNKCHCIVSLISTHNAICNISSTQTQTSLEDHYFVVVRGLVYLSDPESCASGSLAPGRVTRTSRKVEVRRKVIHWPSRLRVGYWANIPVPQKVFCYGNSKRRNQNNRIRGVASIYPHTPVRTAEIWKIYNFHFLKAFLSLNRDD